MGMPRPFECICDHNPSYVFSISKNHATLRVKVDVRQGWQRQLVHSVEVAILA